MPILEDAKKTIEIDAVVLAISKVVLPDKNPVCGKAGLIAQVLR